MEAAEHIGAPRVRPEDLLPGYGPAEVERRVAEAWEFVGGWLPFPRFEPVCMGCGARASEGDVQLRQVTYWSKGVDGQGHRRADVLMKCCRCSLGWTYGVALTEDTYRAATTDGRRVYMWRDVKAALLGAGAEEDR